MKKAYVLLIIIATSVALVGCGKKKEPTFEEKVVYNINKTNAEVLKAQTEIEDLYKQIELLKVKVGVPTKPVLSDTDIKFSSIKLKTETEDIDTTDNNFTLKSDSKFSLIIDVLNSTEESVSQLVCSAFIEYYNNDILVDRYATDSTFEIFEKSVRKNIELKDLPTKTPNLKHKLTIEIKDSNGNIINKLEKDLTIQ